MSRSGKATWGHGIVLLVSALVMYGCPATGDISASPESILKGEGATLSWKTSNASDVSIDNGVGSVSGSGSVVVTPEETTTYTLTARNNEGTVFDSVTVTVSLPPSPTVEFAASPVEIGLGEQGLLSWNTAYAESVVIEPGVGDVSTSGTQTVSPAETTTYTLTAYGPGGNSETTAQIRVIPAPSATISASPSSIARGEGCVVSWTSTDSTSVTIEPGIGAVQNAGTAEVFPQETTTYTVSVQGKSGTATDSATVVVAVPPPTVSIFASPETIERGAQATLTWTSTDAELVNIDNGVGNVGTSGSVEVNPTVDTTYTITATGSGGVATGSVLIEVTELLPSIEFSATPQNILYQQESTVLSWTVTGAQSVFIDQGIGSVAASGTLSVSPDTDTTYTLSATGPAGTASESVTVHVVKLPTVEIEATEVPGVMGTTHALSWTSTNADSASIDQGVGPVPVEGSAPVSPRETTTYTITVSGPGGTASDSVQIEATCSSAFVNLSASRASVVRGESTLLSWDSACANSASITPDIGTVQADGALNVAPQETTTYTIVVVGEYGQASDSVTIGVTRPEYDVHLFAEPLVIRPGETTTLGWRTSDAVSVTLSGFGSVPATGTRSVSPSSTTTYRLVANMGTDTTTDTITVSVVESMDEPTATFTATPQSISKGGSALLQWNSANGERAFIDHKIGLVSLDGTYPVVPEHTTTYILTVVGPTGTVNQETTVEVLHTPEPPPEDGSFEDEYKETVPSDATVEDYDEKRFAVVRGMVQDGDGNTLAGVRICVHGRPDFGTAVTDAGGNFSMAVEGGMGLILNYHKQGYVRSAREVYPGAGEVTVVPTVRLLQEDPEESEFVLNGNPESIMTHKSSPVSDESGVRSSSLVIAGDNTAYVVDEDGNDMAEMPTLRVRATEFVTPETMPATLPATSAYTFCTELRVDGADRVRFDKPVVQWVENFLGFRVGERVPVGYYDRDRGTWVPEPDGAVVRLLDLSGDGKTDALDMTGDNQPNDLDGDGDYADEVVGLDNPEDYAPGTTFWRAEISHFTPVDLNWPMDTVDQDAEKPDPEKDPDKDRDDDDDDCPSLVGSEVHHRSRVFHEDIEIPGTGLTLHYASDRTEGHKVLFNVPVSGDSIRDTVQRVTVRLSVAGVNIEKELDEVPSGAESVQIVWDGKDYRGEPIKSTVKAKVHVGYAYQGAYRSSGMYVSEEEMQQRIESFGMPGQDVTWARAREQVMLWKTDEITVEPLPAELADGWTISNHHQFVSGQKIEKGDGSGAGEVAPSGSRLERIAGSLEFGEYSGDYGPALEANIGSVFGISFDNQGNMYLGSENWSEHASGYYQDWGSVRKVDKDGIISPIIGLLESGYTGDGGPAIDAQMGMCGRIKVSRQGEIYIADVFNHAVRKIDTDGIITTVAGTGVAGFSGDGGAATEAQLNMPIGLALDTQGNLYILDSYNYRVRRVDAAGKIATVAGNGVEGNEGDGGLATNASIGMGLDMALDQEGYLYIATFLAGEDRLESEVDGTLWQDGCIRKVTPGGTIQTEITMSALTEAIGMDEDMEPITYSLAIDSDNSLYLGLFLNLESDMLWYGRIVQVKDGRYVKTVARGQDNITIGFEALAPMALTFSPDGSLYTANMGIIQKVRTEMPISGNEFADQAGYIYEFSDGLTPRHEATLDMDTRIPLYEFNYDDENRLVLISDQFGNATELVRNPETGAVESIISPDNMETLLTVEDGHLTRIEFPDQSAYDFEYTDDGLLTQKTDPNGNWFSYRYDETGRIYQVLDSEGGDWAFSTETLMDGRKHAVAETGEGVWTEYVDWRGENSEYVSSITNASGSTAEYAVSPDGLLIEKDLSCGLEVHMHMTPDPVYGFLTPQETSRRTPGGLEQIISWEKTYEDNDEDGIPDLIISDVTRNGKEVSTWHNITMHTKTVVSAEGRTAEYAYDAETRAVTGISEPGMHAQSLTYHTDGRLESHTIGDRETLYTYWPLGSAICRASENGNRSGRSCDPIPGIRRHGPVASATWPRWQGCTVCVRCQRKSDYGRYPGGPWRGHGCACVRLQRRKQEKLLRDSDQRDVCVPLQQGQSTAGNTVPVLENNHEHL